jgi:hypothetical protein
LSSLHLNVGSIHDIYHFLLKLTLIHGDHSVSDRLIQRAAHFRFPATTPCGHKNDIVKVHPVRGGLELIPSRSALRLGWVRVASASGIPFYVAGALSGVDRPRNPPEVMMGALCQSLPPLPGFRRTGLRLKQGRLEQGLFDPARPNKAEAIMILAGKVIERKLMSELMDVVDRLGLRFRY